MEQPEQEKKFKSNNGFLLWLDLFLLVCAGIMIWLSIQLFSFGLFLWGIGFLIFGALTVLTACYSIYHDGIRQKNRRCPSCSKWMKESIRYCTECGHDFNPPLLTCPSCNELVDKSNKFCPSCGTNLKPASSTPAYNSSIPVAASSLTPTQKNECPSCHEKTHLGEAFCGSCDHLLISTSTQTQLGP